MVSQLLTTSFGPGLVCAGPGLSCVPRLRPKAQCQLLHAPCKNLEHRIPILPAQHCTIGISCEQKSWGQLGQQPNSKTTAPRNLSFWLQKRHPISMKAQRHDLVHALLEHFCPFSCSSLQLWLQRPRWSQDWPGRSPPASHGAARRECWPWFIAWWPCP